MKKCKVCGQVKKLSDDPSLFQAPLASDKLQKWSKAVGVELTPRSFICMKHFKKEFILEHRLCTKDKIKRTLTPSAVPCLSLGCSSSPHIETTESVREKQNFKPKQYVNKRVKMPDSNAPAKRIMAENTPEVPQCAENAVLVKSKQATFLNEEVTGYDWNQGIDYSKLLQTYVKSGFQATNFGLAVNEVNKMIECRNLPLSEVGCDDYEDSFITVKTNCTIFLGYTSNIVSSGLRETVRFLVQHKMVDCIVTTAGGVEEDFIKCLAPTYIGDFNLDGKTLREQAINRIGNLLVPNDNYCKFEDWVMPILDELVTEQKEKGTVWTPSKIITRLGEKIDNEESIYYWAAKNQIPVFSPALTDGSLGDMMFFHSFRNPGLVVDILSDLKRLNMMAIKAVNTGMLIVGGGLVKHHICNANLMRNGADYSVFINTSSEFDGSDAGARPDEAKSWGKIKKDANPVKVYAEASLVFPLLVGETFARNYFRNKQDK